jgi:hypothetical protein
MSDAASVSSASTVDVQQAFELNANKALALLIDKVSSGLDAATSFLAQQIPDVIHQILIYNFVVSLSLCILFLGVVIAWPYVMLWVYKEWGPTLPEHHTYYFDRGNCRFLVVIVAVAGMLFGIVGIFSHFVWLKIWLAPKLYLIEYATQLVKSVSN